MEIIPGGIRHIIFADNPYFNDYTELKAILKRGTSIVSSTDVDEFSENHSQSAGKKTAINFTSADYTEAVHENLKDAEENRTPMYFRVITMHPHYYLDLFAVQIQARRETNEAGKFNAVVVSGSNYAITESGILELVYMFNPFNPENL